MMQKYARLAVPFSGLLLILGITAPLVAQERQPYSLDQLVRMVESGVFSNQRVLSLVGENCLGFVLDDQAVERLSGAGASRELIEALRDVCVVLPPPVDTVAVSPARLELQLGDTVSIRARALAADSSELEGVELAWSSADTTVAKVMPGGVVAAVGAGETRVTVRSVDGPESGVLVQVVDPALATADSIAEAGARSGKSVAAAATLGVVFPGGGEFYTGNRTKGIIVATGAVAALAAGYLIKTEDPIGEPTFTVVDPAQCTPSSCDVLRVQQVEQTRQLVIGAAVAGAFWLYGLVDGIRSARRSGRPAMEPDLEPAGMALLLVPADGIRYARGGGVDLTLVRVRP